MAVRHTATVVASYLYTVESNSESENDDGLTDDNEAGSEAEATEKATEGNEHMPRHVQDRIDRQDRSESGSSGVSVSEVTLPE